MLKTIETLIGHWVTFFKAHEKLLLAIVIASVAWHFGDEAYNAYAAHLKNNVTADNAQIASIEKQNANTQAKLDALTATIAAQAKIDDAKIAAAKQKVVVQQKIDTTLPLPQLSARWQTLLTLPDNSITPQTNGTVAVTADAAHTTVNALEEIAPLQDQLAATQDEYKGCQSLSKAASAQIIGLNSNIAAEKKARVDDAKLAKAEQHKSWMKGFKVGFKVGVVAGFVGGVAVLHKL